MAESWLSHRGHRLGPEVAKIGLSKPVRVGRREHDIRTLIVRVIGRQLVQTDALADRDGQAIGFVLVRGSGLVVFEVRIVDESNHRGGKHLGHAGGHGLNDRPVESDARVGHAEDLGAQIVPDLLMLGAQIALPAGTLDQGVDDFRPKVKNCWPNSAPAGRVVA